MKEFVDEEMGEGGYRDPSDYFNALLQGQSRAIIEIAAIVTRSLPLPVLTSSQVRRSLPHLPRQRANEITCARSQASISFIRHSSSSTAVTSSSMSATGATILSP